MATNDRKRVSKQKLTKAQRQNPEALARVKQKARSGQKLTAREEALRLGEPLPDPSSNRPATAGRGVKPLTLKIKPNDPEQTSGRANNLRNERKTGQQRSRKTQEKFQKGKGK